jgi:hypothetical protein
MACADSRLRERPASPTRSQTAPRPVRHCSSPFATDAAGEQPLRLVAHWLEHQGLHLFAVAREYLWSCPTDELDFARRRQLDAAADLTLAVAVAGNMPDLDRLASDLL